MTLIITKTELAIDVDHIINTEFNHHPFSSIPDNSNYEMIMANYLAMSQAFPYLQAGSQKDIFFSYMNENKDVPEHVELTTIVGNFLCWDETGGLYPTIGMGLKALPHLLETRRFHSNLLKKDCVTLFKKEIKPDYSPVTQKYLMELYSSLSSACSITRVATMVSFESHANKMISALWDSLNENFNLPKNKLNYFMLHVGGEDPAEEYHVAMTRRLIEKTVNPHQQQTFIEQLTNKYKLHHEWCKNVILLSQSL